MSRALDFRRSEVIRDARYDDERIAYEREISEEGRSRRRGKQHHSALDSTSCMNIVSYSLVRIIADQKTHDTQRHQNASGRIAETRAAQRRSGHQSIDYASAV